MKTVQINLYSFNELSEKAKKAAIENYLNSEHELFWCEENLRSIKEGLNFYGFSLDNRYNIDFSSASNSYAPIKSGHNDDIENLQGVRLYKYLNNNYSIYWCKYHKKYRNLLDGNCPFTGYCMDEDFLQPIKDFMKTPTNINFVELMEECVYSCLKAIQNDYEYQNSDEYIIEHFEANNYQFLESGEIF